MSSRATVASVAELRSGKRPVYPFSIVPGGVRSVAELKGAMKTDRLVATHYAAVNVNRLKPVVLNQDRAAYVSFRMHDRVYWTSRKVRLAKGERIFEAADGSIGVRERCGNQVSDQPRTPVLADVRTEPSGAVLATPVVALSVRASSAVGVTAVPLEREATEIPMGGNGPVGFSGGGGTGGLAAVGGGGGGGGGAVGPPGQAAAGTVPPTDSVSPESIASMPIVLPVQPPITAVPLPPPTGWPLVWITPMPTLMIPPSTPTPAVYPWVPGFTTVPLSPVPPVTLEVPPVVPSTVPPDIPAGRPPVTPPGKPPVTPPMPPITAVPEPSTWLMLGAGLGLALWRGRRLRYQG